MSLRPRGRRGARPGRRAFLRGLGVAACVGLTLARARPAQAAGDVRVEVELERESVAVGQPVVLLVKITREGGRDVPSPALPDVLDGEAFEVTAGGVSTGFRSTYVNGLSELVTSRTYRYTLVPLRPGTFKLPVAAVDGADVIQGNEVTLDVTGSAAQVIPRESVGAAPRPLGGVFLWASASTDKAYVGQQVIVDLTLYVREQRDIFGQLEIPASQLRKLPTFEDFWTENLDPPARRRETLEGIPYVAIVQLRRAAFAQRAGTRTIGPAELVYGFRGRASSSPLTIEVLPLPAQGQPPGFSPNNVGRFSLKAAVDRPRVEVGQPFTLTLEIEGDGNLAQVDLGALPAIDGVRSYEPKVETQIRRGATVGGVKRFAVLMIPERAGTVEIPAIGLDHFDPDAAAYVRATSPALQVVVEGAPAAAAGEPPADAPNPAPTSASAELELAALTPEALPRPPLRAPWPDPRTWALGMALPPLLVGIVAGARALGRALGPAEAARLAAERRRRRTEALARARDALGDSHEFAAALAGALQTAAVERAGADAVGLPRPELIARLRRVGLAPERTAELEQLLDELDAARFGARGGTVEARTATLARGEALLRWLERDGGGA